MPLYHDLLVRGVSTQLHRQVDLTTFITASDDDFRVAFKSGFVIRLGFLAVSAKEDGFIGSVSHERHRLPLKRLSTISFSRVHPLRMVCVYLRPADIPPALPKRHTFKSASSLSVEMPRGSEPFTLPRRSRLVGALG